MATTSNVPTEAAAIDAAWLTHALRSEGLLNGSSVSAVRVEPLGGSQGFAGQLRRLRVEYEGSAESVPASYVVKLHSPNEMTRSLIWRLRAAEREIRFYRELSSRAGVPTASMYFASSDGPRFVLLLEDMRPARAGDPVVGCPPEQLEAAVGCVASMHARWWDGEELALLDWIPSFDALTTTRHGISREAWPEFLDRYRGQLPRDFEAVGPPIMDGLDIVRGALAQVPATVLHGDFRPDNVMFADTGTGAPVALVDWQVMLRGPAMVDVAYYLMSAVPLESRRAWEMRVLRGYHAALVAAGVADYPFEQCMRDYRLAMADVLSRIVVLTTRVKPEGAAGWVAFDALAKRVMSAVIDLDCAELLEA